jgi:hypothetical protein
MRPYSTSNNIPSNVIDRLLIFLTTLEPSNLMFGHHNCAREVNFHDAGLISHKPSKVISFSTTSANLIMEVAVTSLFFGKPRISYRHGGRKNGHYWLLQVHQFGELGIPTGSSIL